MFFHEAELAWIRKLHSAIRCGCLDSFFLGWNYVDTFPFMILVIVCTWVFYKKQTGARLLYLFMLSSIFNSSLKKWFNAPRPCQIDPSVGLLHFSSPGFPSGAAQTAVILAGLICLETSQKSYRYLALLFFLLLCFSRIYLGVHYLSDVLGGIIVGAFLLAIYRFFFPWVEKNMKTRLFYSTLSLILIGYQKFLPQVMISAGVAIGLLLSEKFIEEKKSLSLKILESFLIFGGILLCSLIKFSHPILQILSAFFGGFWISFLCSYTLQNVRKLPLLLKSLKAQG